MFTFLRNSRSMFMMGVQTYIENSNTAGAVDAPIVPLSPEAEAVAQEQTEAIEAVKNVTREDLQNLQAVITELQAGKNINASSSEAAVKDIQEIFVFLGVDIGTFGPEGNGVDGDYGATMRRVVSAFQTEKGITVSGEVDQATYDALLVAAEIQTSTGNEAAAPSADPETQARQQAQQVVAEFNPETDRTDREKVRALQTALNTLGATLSVDGNWGTRSQTAYEAALPEIEALGVPTLAEAEAAATQSTEDRAAAEAAVDAARAQAAKELAEATQAAIDLENNTKRIQEINGPEGLLTRANQELEEIRGIITSLEERIASSEMLSQRNDDYEAAQTDFDASKKTVSGIESDIQALRDSMAQLLPQIQREQEEFRSQTEAVRAVQLTLDEAQTVFDDLNYTGDYDNIPTVDSAQGGYNSALARVQELQDLQFTANLQGDISGSYDNDIQLANTALSEAQSLLDLAHAKANLETAKEGIRIIMNQPLIPEVELSRLRAEQSTLSTDIPTLITSLEDARATRERIIARATELGYIGTIAPRLGANLVLPSIEGITLEEAQASFQEAESLYTSAVKDRGSFAANVEASTWDWGVLNLKDDNYFEAAVVLAMVQEREAQIALDNAQERKGVIDTILPGLEDTNRDLQGLLTRKEGLEEGISDLETQLSAAQTAFEEAQAALSRALSGPQVSSVEDIAALSQTLSEKRTRLGQLEATIGELQQELSRLSAATGGLIEEANTAATEAESAQASYQDAVSDARLIDQAAAAVHTEFEAIQTETLREMTAEEALKALEMLEKEIGHGAIKAIQQALIDAGVDLGATGADGDVGPLTRAGIEDHPELVLETLASYIDITDNARNTERVSAERPADGDRIDAAIQAWRDAPVGEKERYVSVIASDFTGEGIDSNRRNANAQYISLKLQELGLENDPEAQRMMERIMAEGKGHYENDETALTDALVDGSGRFARGLGRFPENLNGSYYKIQQKLQSSVGRADLEAGMRTGVSGNANDVLTQIFGVHSDYLATRMHVVTGQGADGDADMSLELAGGIILSNAYYDETSGAIYAVVADGNGCEGNLVVIPIETFIAPPPPPVVVDTPPTDTPDPEIPQQETYTVRRCQSDGYIHIETWLRVAGYGPFNDQKISDEKTPETCKPDDDDDDDEGDVTTTPGDTDTDAGEEGESEGSTEGDD